MHLIMGLRKLEDIAEQEKPAEHQLSKDYMQKEFPSAYRAIAEASEYTKRSTSWVYFYSF